MAQSLDKIQWTHLRQVLEEFAQYFIDRARENLGANHSYASGTLGDTMTYEVIIEDDKFSVRIELESYWEYVEHGRPPGKFPPPPYIIDWILVKPVNRYPDASGKTPSINSLAYLIGRKIANEGTDPAPFFEKAKQDAIEHYEVAINDAIREDIETYLMGIIDEFANLFK